MTAAPLDLGRRDATGRGINPDANAAPRWIDQAAAPRVNFRRNGAIAPKTQWLLAAESSRRAPVLSRLPPTAASVPGAGRLRGPGSNRAAAPAADTPAARKRRAPALSARTSRTIRARPATRAGRSSHSSRRRPSPCPCQGRSTANKSKCAASAPYRMIPKPAIRSPARATSTLVSGWRRLASTRRGTQDQGKPVSISVRESRAIAAASALRANANALSGTIMTGLSPLERPLRRYSTLQPSSVRAARAN